MKSLIEIFLEQLDITHENNNDEILSSKFSNFIEKFLHEIILEIDTNSNNFASEERTKNEEFQSRNNKRWHELFLTYEILLSCCLDAVQSWRSRNDTGKDILASTLLRLHAKGYLIAREVLYLCQGGYPDGALARWRSLHEIICISLFILKYGEECAERFVYHSIADEINFFKTHDTYKNRLKVKAQYDKDEHKQLTAFLDSKYEENFKNPYGWARKFIKGKPDRLSFAKIEKDINLDHYRFFYANASHGIHGSFLHLIDNLSLRECKENILLVGQSNSGMALPISCASLSLSIITSKLLSMNSEIEDVISIKLIDHYRREIERIITQSKE